MKSIFQKVIDFFNKGKYTTNENAAAIIRRLVNNTFTYPLEWDDFETQNEDNPEAHLALELCFFFAKKFPGDEPVLCCSEKAFLYFLKIADALENNQFHDLDHEAVKESIKKNELPKSVSTILGIKDLNKDINQ